MVQNQVTPGAYTDIEGYTDVEGMNLPHNWFKPDYTWRLHLTLKVGYTEVEIQATLHYGGYTDMEWMDLPHNWYKTRLHMEVTLMLKVTLKSKSRLHCTMEVTLMWNGWIYLTTGAKPGYT